LAVAEALDRLAGAKSVGEHPSVTDEPSRDIRLLGRFVVLAGSEEIAPSRFVGRLSKRLLRILAVHAGEHRSKDVLAEALWPERAPADPGANLEVLVARVRKGLGVPEFTCVGNPHVTAQIIAQSNFADLESYQLIEFDTVRQTTGPVEKEHFGRRGFGLIF
jgi:DNA-binding SARP family transcriptional activator